MTPRVRPLDTMDPKRLGGYRLLGVLGEGGQGTVYLGEASGRRVAIKVLHARIAEDAVERRRFAREVDAAHRVAAFCTASVVDRGVHGGRPYVISEYIPGPSLKDLVGREGPRIGSGLERLAVATLTALRAIHGAGIVHRDLKPTNVIMGPEGPVVIDFGISQLLDQITTRSMVIGTPAYMAPEQFRGHTAGPASDVFAWASLMVFAATARHAFRGESPPEVMYAVMACSPDLSGVPQPLRPLIDACMTADPEARPGVDDLLARLTTTPPSQDDADPGLTTLPPEVPPPPTTRWPRRRVLGAAVSACAAATVSTVFATRSHDTSSGGTPAAAPPIRAVTIATGSAALCVAVTTLDGRPVALTGGADGTIRTWSLETGAQLGTTQQGHTGPVRSLSADRLDDGQVVAVSGGADGFLRMWQIALDRDLGPPFGRIHSGAIGGLAIGRLDGHKIAVTASDDGTAGIWDLATGWALGRRLSGQGPLQAVAVTRLYGRAAAVTGGRDGVVRIWDLLAAWQQGPPLTGHKGPVRDLVSGHLDGRPIAISSGDDGTARLWDLEQNLQLGPSLLGHTGSVPGVALFGSPPRAVTAGSDRTLRVWDLSSFRKTADLGAHTAPLTAVATIGDVIVATSTDGVLRTWPV